MMRIVNLAKVAMALICSPIYPAVIPRPAADYSIQLPDGKNVKVGQYRGKVVALEFILTTCAHCQQAAQMMDKMQTEFGSRGFQALGAAINENAAAAVPEFVKVLKLGFPVGVGSRDAAVDFLQHPIMTNMIMPQLVFIDRKGQIQAQFPGNHPFLMKNEETNVRNLIKKLLIGLPSSSKPAAARKRSS